MTFRVTSGRCLATVAAALLLLTGGVRADGDDTPDLRKRVEKLEAQNEALRREVEEFLRQGKTRPDAVPGQTPAGDGPTTPSQPPEAAGQATTDAKGGTRDAPAAGGDGDDGWLEVGKKLGLHGVWVNHQPWFETEDGSFRIHFGSRVHFDGVWANATDRVENGKGGTGPFQDGVNFRRLRFEIDGWMYEVVDFFVEVDFTQTVNDDPTQPANVFTNVTAVPSVTEAYASVNYLPWIGTVRIGNQKPPILLEHVTSSRFLDFMERSALFDAYFNRSNGFEPGIEVNNWTENERVTWQAAVMKNVQTIQPFGVSGGDYQLNGRITGLPWYEDEGRYMVHLGFGVQYDEPDHQTAILRERWLLRNGPPTTQNTVALASLVGHNQVIAVPEFFMNLGSLSVQAEYLAHHMDDITSFTTQTQGTVNVHGPSKSFFSQGAYVEVMYFLTGEYRPYERTPLHAGGARPTRVVPLRNFFWVPGAGGFNPFSSGAWQVGARYSYSDLTNNGINGGQVNEMTLGLNWFLNPNLKIQWNYDVGYRGQLGPGSTSNGTFQGFGTRLAFDF